MKFGVGSPDARVDDSEKEETIIQRARDEAKFQSRKRNDALNGLEMGFLNSGGYYLYLVGMFFYAGLTYKETGSLTGNAKAWGARFWKLIPKLIKHYRIGMGALTATSVKGEKGERWGRNIAGIPQSTDRSSDSPAVTDAT
jgi:hypothetical protein